MRAIYNEIEPFAAAWLRELERNGHIAPGVVDERSIEDLTPADVAGPGQRHFFAGIGGWSYALRLAGVPDDVSVWTGSCPCQPFSAAGSRRGTSDPRHLWPAWFALIRECRPAIIFGEQVASRDGLGWLDAVYADLERCGYAVGAADLCAAGVGAPHIRQRLYFVAYADEGSIRESVHVLARRSQQQVSNSEWRRDAGALADSSTERQSGAKARSKRGGQSRTWAGCELGDSDRQSSGGNGSAVSRAQSQGSSMWSCADRPWASGVIVDCSDGQRRPIPAEPEFFPLAHGVPGRVGRLRGYGNAIVPQVAAAFIQGAIEVMQCR